MRYTRTVPAMQYLRQSSRAQKDVQDMIDDFVRQQREQGCSVVEFGDSVLVNCDLSLIEARVLARMTEEDLEAAFSNAPAREGK